MTKKRKFNDKKWIEYIRYDAKLMKKVWDDADSPTSGILPPGIEIFSSKQAEQVFNMVFDGFEIFLINRARKRREEDYYTSYGWVNLMVKGIRPDVRSKAYRLVKKLEQLDMLIE